MKNTLKFALTALLFAVAPLAQADTIDCVRVSNAVRSAVTADSGKVLEIVAQHIAANASCACEVVKAAIIASDAEKEVVAQIVDVAINEAPAMLRIIAQCAIAIAPDAGSNIQAVLEKYDFVGGEGYSEKGGLEKGGLPADEDSTAVAAGNPLDFPVGEPVDTSGRVADSGSESEGGGAEGGGAEGGGAEGGGAEGGGAEGGGAATAGGGTASPPPVGPAAGGPGGFPMLPPGLPPTFPPVVTPPKITGTGSSSTVGG
jgi:hypothetical protein